MEPIHVFLMDMTWDDNTSGVDRYLEMLTEGLQVHPGICIHRLQLLSSQTQLFVRRKTFPDGGTFTQVPLPRFMSEMLEKSYWSTQYNAQVYRLVCDLFVGKKRCILHLHTLNLIDLAVYIRSRHPDFRILTHLHCIPWKALYNHDRKRFNRLYAKAYLRSSFHPEQERKAFIRQESEWRAYQQTDSIICVTECARDFLQTWIGRKNSIYVIPNGTKDLACGLRRNYHPASETFHCLYVGVLSESKGITYIIEALQKVAQKGYQTQLTACGRCTPTLQLHLKQKYPDVTIDLRGLVEYDTLQDLYRTSDIGIIASLQEQSSYVAIEMMMYGLPVVTTAVDGLDEMFENGVSGLKVNTSFSPVKGLSANTDMMTEKIITLIQSETLRKAIGCGGRQRYASAFTLERMTEETIKVYNDLTN